MTERIKRGDAEAILEAFGGGGWAILKHSKVAQGSPADQAGSHGAIRPFKLWDGVHLCSEDWHVILIADIEGGDASFTQQQAEQIMSGIEVRFFLDGERLITTRTAIKRFLNSERFDLAEAYYFQEGRVMSPEELTAGRHRLECEMTAGSDIVFRGSIRFVVDAAGEGTCV
jgi:hypothetical protein